MEASQKGNAEGAKEADVHLVTGTPVAKSVPRAN
jgi:hypothetical protein